MMNLLMKFQRGMSPIYIYTPITRANTSRVMAHLNSSYPSSMIVVAQRLHVNLLIWSSRARERVLWRFRRCFGKKNAQLNQRFKNWGRQNCWYQLWIYFECGGCALCIEIVLLEWSRWSLQEQIKEQIQQVQVLQAFNTRQSN